MHINETAWGSALNVCFPGGKNQGLASQVLNHFSSAPDFLIADVTTSEFQSVSNSVQIHQHGSCNPVGWFDGEHVDAIDAGGIGFGALHKLNAASTRKVPQAIAGQMRLANCQHHPK